MECAPCAPPKVPRGKCEDCGQKRPSCNVPSARGKKCRWCSECAQKHTGAVCVKVQATCEDCGQKQPTCSVPGAPGKKRRWCGECAQKYTGAVCMKVQATCEECGQKQPSKRRRGAITVNSCR